MSKFVKYSIASDGRLVYRSNGNVVRQAKTLEIKGNRVYLRGRLHGYIADPKTKKAKIQIEKKAQNRVKRAEKARARKAEAELKEFTDAVLDLTSEESMMSDWTEETEDNGWRNLATVKRAWYETPHAFRNDIEITVSERSVMNYASALRSMVDEGYCTVEGANRAFTEYQEADSKRRTEMWNELHR